MSTEADGALIAQAISDRKLRNNLSPEVLGAYDLSPAEFEAIKHLNGSALEEFSERLDSSSLEATHYPSRTLRVV